MSSALIANCPYCRNPLLLPELDTFIEYPTEQDKIFQLIDGKWNFINCNLCGKELLVDKDFYIVDTDNGRLICKTNKTDLVKKYPELAFEVYEQYSDARRALMNWVNAELLKRNDIAPKEPEEIKFYLRSIFAAVNNKLPIGVANRNNREERLDLQETLLGKLFGYIIAIMQECEQDNSFLVTI